MLNTKIICCAEQYIEPAKTYNGSVVVQSSDNSQTLYIDGSGEPGWPIYVGVTKSKGTQDNKLPIEPNEIIGGLQVYARVKQGSSLGYCHEETPLTGSIIFKAGDTVEDSELLVSVKKDNELSVKLVLDSTGNLKVAGSVSLGNLTITDQPASVDGTFPIKFVKVYYNGTEYAMPLYSTR